MRTPFERDGLVAFGPRGDRSSADLWSAAHRVARVLPRDAEGRSALLVFEGDRFLFTAALLASWSRGLVAMVPPDNQRATLTRLQHLPEVVTILHDTESGLAHRVQDILREPGPVPDLDPFLERLEQRWLDAGPLVTLFAGVARGERAPITLGGPALASELARLGAHPLPPGARVAGSVPVGHRYGLVHTVLRPLAEGGAFFGSLGPSSMLAEALPELAADVLVTHPKELCGLLARSPPVAAITCAGAPLSAELSARAEATLGARPLDLFTLSKTGALAARSDPSELWTPLDGVRVVGGPAGAVFEIAGERLTTADAIREESGGRFRTMGRHDRRALLGGRELDLDALERRLSAAAGGADVAVIVAGSAVLGAVAPNGATPVPAAPSALLARDPLLDGIEGVEIDVRVASSLPRDGMGRLPRGRLLALFGRGPDGRPRVETLEIVALDEAPGSFEIIIPEDYRWFDGHFDQYPILPAAVQLRELVVPCARRAGLLEGPVGRFERLKFSRRITPGMRLGVHVRVGRGGAVAFELTGEAGLLTSGRLVAAEEPAP